MLESIRRGQRWLTGLFIAVIGGVFVFFIGLGGGPMQGGPSAGADTVVALDDITLTLRDYERMRARQYARLEESIGAGLQQDIAEQFAGQQALRSLIETAILAHSATELGLAAGKREIQDILRNDPSLRDAEGRFDRDNFERLVEYEFGSQRLFLETMRLDLLRQKMVQILLAQAYVSEAEARAATRLRLEEAEIAAVVLDKRSLPAELALSHEDVVAYADANETNLRALYDEEPTRFGHPLQTRVRHLLLKVEPDAEASAEEAVRERIVAARARIEGGEDFGDVARDLSEDRGTRDAGGEFGWVARAELEPALASVAFDTLEAGQLSEPVRGFRGFHLVEVQERREAGVQSYDQVRLELARRQAETSRAAERARTLADELEAAIASGSTLEDAARERELTLARTGRFRRRADGAIPQVGASRDLMAAVFASAPATPSLPKVWSIDDRLVLVQVLAHHEPLPEEIDSEYTATIDQLRNQRREQIIRAWIDEREQELNDEGRLFVNAAVLSQG